MERGLVTIGYSGACLFVGDANEIVGLDTEVTFTTGFTGTRSLSRRPDNCAGITRARNAVALACGTGSRSSPLSPRS